MILLKFKQKYYKKYYFYFRKSNKKHCDDWYNKLKKFKILKNNIKIKIKLKNCEINIFSTKIDQ
jgi:hypothetical protein